MKFPAIILLLLVSLTSGAQSSFNSTFTKVFNCHEKTGCQTLGEGYKQNLMIRFDERELGWRKSIYEGWTMSQIRKKSDQYVIGIQEELYTYVDLKSKSVYYIEFYRNSYQTWGYGSDTLEVKSRVNEMMSMLIKHKTQKDVMQFLIDRTESASN